MNPNVLNLDLRTSDIVDFYFQWPWAFLLLLLIPLFTFLYLRFQRKRWQNALRFSQGAVVEHLKLNPSPWKRFLAPGTALLLMFLLTLSLSRPTVVARVPTQSVDMMMVMDISLSMLAEDIKPNRMEAAREAAINFVKSLPREVRVGLTFFAGGSYVLSPPVRDHHKVVALLKALRKEDLQQRTEIGTAIVSALKTLQTEEPKPNIGGNSGGAGVGQAPQNPGNESVTKEKREPQKVILLISDGDSHEGYPWNQAALKAKERKVSIFTVGIGSPEETTIVYQNQVLPVSFNESTLRKIAELADGQFFRVFAERDFKKVYGQIRERSIHFEERPEDLSYVFSGVALMLLLFSSMLSMFWVKRVP